MPVPVPVVVVPNAPVVGCPKIGLFAAKKDRVRLRERSRIFVLTGTKSPGAKRACLGLLGSSTEGSGGLGLRLTKRSGSGAKSTSACGRSAFEVLAARVRVRRDNRTESAGGRLLAETRGTRTKETSSLLLLRLCGAESPSAEAGRLLGLSWTKRTKPGSGLLLLWLLWLLLLWLLGKCTKPGTSCGTSGSESTSAATESGLSRLCCGLGLVEQATRCRRLCCRAKTSSTKTSSGGGFTILLVVLQPEFLRRAKGTRE